MTTDPTRRARSDERPRLPVWANSHQICRTLGLDSRVLRKLPVRSLKLGTSRQAGRLWHTGDVLNAIDELQASPHGCHPAEEVQS